MAPKVEGGGQDKKAAGKHNGELKPVTRIWGLTSSVPNRPCAAINEQNNPSKIFEEARYSVEQEGIFMLGRIVRSLHTPHHL